MTQLSQAEIRQHYRIPRALWKPLFNLLVPKQTPTLFPTPLLALKPLESFGVKETGMEFGIHCLDFPKGADTAHSQLPIKGLRKAVQSSPGVPRKPRAFLKHPVLSASLESNELITS